NLLKTDFNLKIKIKENEEGRSVVMYIEQMLQLIQQQAMLTLTENKRNNYFLAQPSMNIPFHQLLDQKIHEVNEHHQQQTNKNIETNPVTTQQTPTNYEPYIKEAAEKYNIDERLIHAIIKNESNYDTEAESYAGAQGLMQLMPNTARNLGVTDPFDPKQNIEGGTKYLSHLLHHYNNNTELALAAYNAGPGNVAKHEGIPPFKETTHYVQDVLHAYLS